MRAPLITEIQRFSLQDGPGIRTTLYLKGCPLHCPWCHNPEAIRPMQEVYFHASRCMACGRCADECRSGSLRIVQAPDGHVVLRNDPSKCVSCLQCVEVCPNDAREVVGNRVDTSSIVSELLADEVFFKFSGGGVTISGGEPLLYPQFLVDLARRLKEAASVHIAIETSGYSRWDAVRKLLPLVDLFIVDIKTMSPDKYAKVIGGSLQLVLSNIDGLINSGAAVRIHLPIIPGFNDDCTDADAYVDYLAPRADKLSGVDVLPFHSYATGKYSQLCREYAFKDVDDMAYHKVMPLVDALKKGGLRQVTVGGIAGARSPEVSESFAIYEGAIDEARIQ